MYELTLKLFSGCVDWFWFKPVEVVYQAQKTKLIDAVSGPCIIVANHRSEFDPWLLAHAFRDLTTIHFVAKAELCDVSSRYWACRANLTKLPSAVATPVAYLMAQLTKLVVPRASTVLIGPTSNGNIGSVKAMLALLKENHTLGIFPLGDISQTGEKSITTRLARRDLGEGRNAVIIPVRILPKPDPWNRHTPWQVVVGQPLAGNDTALQRDTTKKEMLALMAHIYCLSPGVRS